MCPENKEVHRPVNAYDDSEHAGKRETEGRKKTNMQPRDEDEKGRAEQQQTKTRFESMLVN